MPRPRKHRAFLRTVSRIGDVTSSLAVDDLEVFAQLAEHEMPAFAPIFRAYAQLATATQSDVEPQAKIRDKPTSVRAHASSEKLHLFDLLRSKELFPTNVDLAEFAARILPDMERRRFGKMSRGDIAVRIIEYVESLPPNRRHRLEEAMRDAVRSDSITPQSKRTFFTEWESIIKRG